MSKKLTAMLLVIMPFLISCSMQKKFQYRAEWIKDTNGFDLLIKQLSNNIENIWGINEVLIAGPKDYIKYSDNYQTRSHIDFEKGQIIIETINSSTSFLNSLLEAIISVLLINSDPSNLTFYSDSTSTTIKVNEEPLLYGQVLDNTGKPIRWHYTANHFANYLLQNKLKKRISGSHVIWAITIPMVSDHLDKRAHKYLPLVHKFSEIYHVDPSLILSIIQIESSFNPYAVSHSNALGLMQIIRDTAGLDVFRMKGKFYKPSRHYLLDPKNNIEIGTAYLSMLQNIYLSQIEDPLSRLYAVITSYNAGPASVLRLFSDDKNHAFTTINNMSSQQFYNILINKHPSMESRIYLRKVNAIQHKYHHF